MAEGVRRILSIKNSIRVSLILCRLPLNASTVWTSTASCGRLFHLPTILLENNFCLRLNNFRCSLPNLIAGSCVVQRVQIQCGTRNAERCSVYFAEWWFLECGTISHSIPRHTATIRIKCGMIGIQFTNRYVVGETFLSCITTIELIGFNQKHIWLQHKHTHTSLCKLLQNWL